ncbi:MAG: CHRD protein [Alteromonadaceae bacterium]|nr:MAG: CHRD protein [Alteromonadaceae bacterium]
MFVVPASAGVINLTATIDGAQANAGAGSGSSGMGMADMTLDDVSKMFSWNIWWQDLSGAVSSAHFHGPALPDQNTGVQVSIGDISSPSMGMAMISDSQIDDLLAGLWYINIHTVMHPGGEIRGQVNVVPEPEALILLGVALLALSLIRRRRISD